MRVALGDEIERLAHGDLHRLIQILVESHDDPMAS